MSQNVRDIEGEETHLHFYVSENVRFKCNLKEMDLQNIVNKERGKKL